MKLRKIFNFDAFQAYQIVSPSKRIKTMFPRKYLFIIYFNGRTLFGNTDTIPQQFYYTPIVGYMFTYEKTLPDILKSNQYTTYTYYGRTHPLGLDQYFINSNSNGIVCDLVLYCTGANDVMPVQMIENIIIRCNSHQLVGNETKDVDVMAKNIKTNIRKIISNMLKAVSPTCVEDWIVSILEHAPLNDNDMPYRFPDIITDNLFKTKTISIKNNQISIGYDLRADNYDFESKFIHAMETAFETLNQKVVIYDTYNGIMKKIIEEFKKKDLKYEKVTDHSIEVKLSDLWGLKSIEYEITDLI